MRSIKKITVFVFLLSVSAPFAALADEKDSIDRMLQSAFVRSIRWIESESASEVLNIYNSTSMVLRFDRDIIRIAVSNPDICDITPVGASDILINAKRVGKSNLIVWDQDGSIATYGIQSILDIERLEKVLHKIDPNADLRIIPFNATLAVYGEVETSVKLKQMTEAIKSFDGSCLNFLKIRKPKQILLEVRFAEIDRTTMKNFKFDINVVGRFGPFGSAAGQTGALSGAKSGIGKFTPHGSNWDFGPALTPVPGQTTSDIFWQYYNNFFVIEPYLKFLESQNLLKVIARPNLIAKDGEESEFKVGGEYPVPVNGSNNEVTISYKEYGTSMKFSPEILDEEVIRLKIRAEVSDIDTSTTVTSGGVTVPAIIKRTQASVLEMKENQTLVIGGMISQKITKVHRKIPGLGDIPLFGKIFNADQLDRTDVELVIVITPHIVRPMNLDENKEFFDENLVKQSIRGYEPTYTDPQGDSIQQMYIQNEKLEVFKLGQKQPDAEQFADSLANKLQSSSKDDGSERSWGWKAVKTQSPPAPKPVPKVSNYPVTPTPAK